jgi:hypothetical protein
VPCTVWLVRHCRSVAGCVRHGTTEDTEHAEKCRRWSGGVLAVSGCFAIRFVDFVCFVDVRQ